MLSQDENLILQELISVSFILELHKNNLLESEFYKKMHFDNPSISVLMENIKIDNQGMLLMFLYSLLLTPKEKIYKDYKNDYDLLDKKINDYIILLESTYDESETKYIKHIRNAIGHGRVEFTNNSIKFYDFYRNKKFLVEVRLDKIGHILNELQKILYKYIDDLKARV